MQSSRRDGLLPLEQRFTYRFALVASRMGTALAPSHERYGLSVGTWRVLAVIARYEPLSAKELAQRTSTDPFRVTRALTTLAEKGFVSRQADPQDRRRVSLRLTRAGRGVHDEIAATLSEMERSVLVALSAREQAVLHRLLDKLDARIAACLQGQSWSVQGPRA
ncbi:MAG: MarR family transcriptional regulator [Steroidobacteraceae bacterium]|nr:MarR family transcriptional regulator [Steroidobacteraceae bacterium]